VQICSSRGRIDPGFCRCSRIGHTSRRIAEDSQLAPEDAQLGRLTAGPSGRAAKTRNSTVEPRISAKTRNSTIKNPCFREDAQLTTGASGFRVQGSGAKNPSASEEAQLDEEKTPRFCEDAQLAGEDAQLASEDPQLLRPR
jgi:hypothetical protein